jgi:hypothetical protein
VTIQSKNVRAALQRHLGSLAGDHERIIDAMAKSGLINDGDDTVRASAGTPIPTLAAAAAADPRKRELIQSVVAQAKHLGVTLDPDKVIDPFVLSADLKKAGIASNEQCFRLKTALAQIGAIA